MNKQIFVNLAVKDLEKSKAFYSALGYSFNPQFTNEQGACMIVAEDSIFVMLLAREFMQTFTDKALGDPREVTTTLITLSCDSEEKVNSLVAKAVAHGGKMPRPPEDYGFMYTHGFEDIDGHGWGLGYMRGAPA
ncbi:glyoxalase/bleomycin resistance/extradiol dioxygenase family protein [Massilia arenosa]|uniref:Glyoxalase/bleomycin resistance/extradiol dioxygenase family protein n=1 Tax=Zemynaea arenosa TaxID=2561931 RepID=A0A4Y9SFS5_9BURK|nr:VOC family protein [Massilia arenosa]TFW19817.1 glyoxalase/bleomycin resistance/extradiol dioxygenase family protein [Massilia arenosa]